MVWNLEAPALISKKLRALLKPETVLKNVKAKEVETDLWILHEFKHVEYENLSCRMRTIEYLIPKMIY